MTEAKALFNSPSNRGAAFILNQNVANTPLGLLQEQQAQQQQAHANAAKLKAQQEKDAMERMDKIIPKVGKYLPADHEYISKSLTDIRDYMAEGSKLGMDYTNYMSSPQEAARLHGMVQELNNFAQLSAQDLEKITDFQKLYHTNSDGTLDSIKGKELMETFIAATPEERRKMNLSTNRLYNTPLLASKTLEHFKPSSEQGYTLDGKGGKKTYSIKEFSEDEMQSMRKSLAQNQVYTEALRSQYESLPEEDRATFGGFKPYLEQQINDAVEAQQRREIERDYDTDDVYNSYRNHKLALQRENRMQANANEGEKKEQDKLMQRAKFLQAAANGDWELLGTLANAKEGGSNILKVEPVNQSDPGFKSGKVSGVKDLYGSDEYQTPVIKLTVKVGQTKDADGKLKVETKTVTIDTSEPKWYLKFSQLMNTDKGNTVAPEPLEELARSGQFDFNAKKKTSSTSNPYGISLEDESKADNPYNIEL